MDNVLTDSAEGRRDGLKNLEFLREFMAVQGISVSMAAELMGYTRHAILKWFRTDDAMLSVVQFLFERCGYRLVLTMDRPQEGRSVKVSLPNDGPSMPTRRLAFLDRALKSAGLSHAATSKMLGMSQSSVGYWLRVDDCAVSRLFEIAEKTGMVLSIEIRKR